MKIELKSLTLTNFKGIKQLQVNFDHETAISGMNATGKTTIFDAFLWLLFGKDSTDRKDFGLKTLDENGKEIPMIEHEVISKLAIWDADDNDIPRIMILRRTFKEKWTKPRGQSQAEFSGNETIYYVDAVPCSQKEYNEKVDSICKENLFKLLTNPSYFPGLNWAVQRQSLFSLIPEVTTSEIVETIPLKAKQQGKFEELFKIINAQKSMEDYRKEIASKKRTLNDELVLIPARIDEVHRGTPEPEDLEVIEKAISDATEFIKRKETEKTNKLASVETETTMRAGIQAEINNCKQQITTIRYKVEDAIRDKTRETEQKKEEHNHYLSDYGSLIQKANNTLTGLRLDMEQLQAERTKLISEWKFLNAETMPQQTLGVCPTCGQELPEDFKAKTQEENLKTWNEGKAGRIELNTKKGKNVAGQITQKQEQIDKTVANIEKLTNDLETVNKGWRDQEIPSETMGASGASPAALSFVAQVDTALKANEEYQKLLKDSTSLTAKLEKFGPIAAVDVSDIEKEISFARGANQEKNTKLAKREIIKKAEERKAELKASQTKLSQEIAELEQMEFSIETFIRTKVTMLEQRINSMFELVKFKMFDLQINGQLAEACECSIDGVPYSDLNRAARINAGLDIINTMSRKYGITAPVFIDNAESTNEFIPTKAQMIKLYVTLDKELIIT